jgi:hypothetical protein
MTAKTAFITGLTCAAMAAVSSAADFYVAPAGADGSPGSAAKPFATLRRARDAVRASGALKREPVIVHVLPGVYYLPDTLTFTDADSGSASAPVVYQAEAGGEAVVSGGLKLDLRWKPHKGGIWQADVPAGLTLDQLFVNGERRHMARYPNFDPDQRMMHGYAADAFSKERASRWADPAGGYLHAMHPAHWGDVHFRITGKKPDGSLAYEGGWQNNRGSAMHKEHRFVENVFEELDAPGEWFHNAKTGVLHFYPPAGLDLKSAAVEAVRLRHLIELKGEPKRPAAFITLRGFTFRHAARTFMENREPLNRSDWTTYRGGAVLAEGTEDCQVLDCTFDQVGGNTVFVNAYNRRFAVRECLIQSSGANGVAFVGDARAVRSPLLNYGQAFDYAALDRTPGPLNDNYPSDCLVEECLITRTGTFERQTAPVQISMALGVTVRHCSIYDVPRAGINISEGCWGGHVVEFCDIFDTVKETGDHGSFNSWGRDRFWHPDPKVMNREVAADPKLPALDVLKPNILRNSRWRCDHGWDIDLDDGSSHYEIYNNLCLNGGLKNREGYARKVTNNILVNNTFHPHVWLANSGDVFKNNIVMGAYRPAVMPPDAKWGQEIDDNLFTTDETDRARFAKNGCDAHSLSGDPQFVNPAAGDYTVKEDSPALKLGFKNFPMDQFGVQKPSLKALARTPELPQLKKEEKAADARAAARPDYFCRARVRDIEGLGDRSAYGLPDETGVLLLDVLDGSALAKAGFVKDDVILACDGKPVRNAGDLRAIQASANGAPLKVSALRRQQTVAAEVRDYAVVAAESADSADTFKSLPLAEAGRTLPLKVTVQGKTNNEAPAVLADGKLAPNYGPVFGNGVSTGAYKADLGAVKSVGAVLTFSYNQNKNRGRQNFVLYGSAAAADPGWDVLDARVFTPLAVVDTPADPASVYVGTLVRAAGGAPLGSYRWLVWRVYPVTDSAGGENTAFQECQVVAD